MTNTLEVLVTGGLIAMVPLTIGYLVLVPFVFSRLERAHPRTYQDLGSPSLLTSISYGVRFTRFLLRRDYATLGDRALCRLADVARWQQIAGISILLLSFIASTTPHVL